jgi:HD-like signal output (HDOD) protein/ActR/RegA family two-component response regulator
MSNKVRIAFVDDETHVLRGLRRSMSEMEGQWDTSFHGSARDALEAMAAQPVDVLVSDMRMPEMDGAQLLDAVRRRWPQTIRIILSGFAEQGSVLRTVGPAHIYLAKPCDPQSLKDAIERPLALRRHLASLDLQAVLGGLANLPSAPGPFTALDAELRSPTASAGSVARILSDDLAMTAEILKLTNSSFFALHARVTSPLQAVRTLGIEIIRTLVLQIGIFRQLGGGSVKPALLEALNRYSLLQGRLAEDVARDEIADSATIAAAHCAGTLAGIGHLVFLDLAAERYLAALAAVEPGGSVAEAELAAFGATHTHVGAYLLGLWGFSDAIVEAVAFADRPAQAPMPDSPVLMAVHAARALGPPSPMLAVGAEARDKLDMAYLVDMRKDGRVRHWRELVTERLNEVG